ncbi:unnamed protein product [Adineta steineri]|uniref:Uncharacterized protein n=1 Tax=Adineta steineri TaxID=433720 RepID=A0A814R5E5_9BILA|nr:unnamed protein product [Adineta steineri]CAF1310814.1 unnamed protein product [Adineta steineri]
MLAGIIKQHNELQTKRETIKRYEQELQSMKCLLEITLKEKQIQNDQLQYERQYGNMQQNDNRFIQMNKLADNEITEDVISRRLTSTPT